MSTVPASRSHKLVEEDPRKVVIAAVLLEAQARLEGLLVDLEEEVEVDLHPLVFNLLVDPGVNVALGDLGDAPTDGGPLEEDRPADECIGGRLPD